MNQVADPSAFQSSAIQTDRATIRVGVIGLGRSGAFFHCRPLHAHPNFEVAGVSDVRPETRRKVAEDFGCREFTRATDLLDSPDIDLVVLAVPTRCHGELALEAISRGKAVLVEKPFASSSREAREIFSAGQKAGVPVYAYHNRRFDPDVQTLATILSSGVLGDIVKVSLHLHSYSRRKDWQTLRSMGGGALSNWGAHAIDWCFHLFGPDLAFKWGRLSQVLNPGDAEDTFLVSLTSGFTSIQLEYLNCAAEGLPKWHVVGRHGTAVSGKDHFSVRYCDPDLLRPLEAEQSIASDGTYAIKEELGWQTSRISWDGWDNCPAFLDALHAHMIHGAPVPVSPEEVVRELALIEDIRSQSEAHTFPTINGQAKMPGKDRAFHETHPDHVG